MYLICAVTASGEEFSAETQIQIDISHETVGKTNQILWIKKIIQGGCLIDFETLFRL